MNKVFTNNTLQMWEMKLLVKKQFRGELSYTINKNIIL